MKLRLYCWPDLQSGRDSSMLLSALDPALLVYKEEHWRTEQRHFLDRIGTLLMHRQTIKQLGLEMAVSADLVASVYELFPWNAEFKSISEFRDLRQFVLDELGRARYFQGSVPADRVSLQPGNLTCMYVEIDRVSNAWKELLYACAEEESSSEVDFQVATSETAVNSANSRSIVVTVVEGSDSASHEIPLVWSKDSWALRINSQDSWPDLQRCVEFYFQANPGMQKYPQLREHPLPFDCTDNFWKSVNDLCQPRMRQLLVKAIAKKVYGILDVKLHDEPLGRIRRFRVTDFWRVHYRQFDDRIVLEEFGEHDMGL